MDNKFLELSSSPLMNLDHTKRYSGTKLVEEETLSQHIVDTIMMGLKIIDKINTIAGVMLIDPEIYLTKAVYHDLEEVITGDIPRPVKYYNKSTRSSLQTVATNVAKEFFDKQFDDGMWHYHIWESAKEGLEGYILKIVDNLVVSNKVVREVTLLNNFYFLRVAHEVVQYTRSILKDAKSHPVFKDEVQEYILELLYDAIAVVEEILSEHQDVLRKLNICDQSIL